MDTPPGGTLPDSYDLASKPAFFGAYAWPWVDASGATGADRVKSLPAQARFAAGSFFADP